MPCMQLLSEIYLMYQTGQQINGVAENTRQICCIHSLIITSVTTGFRRFARCRMHPAKATLHLAKLLPGATLGKEPSAKNQSANIFLPGAFYRTPGKDFAECKPGTRQRKVVVTAPAPSSLALPGRHPAKIFFLFFFIISLPGVVPRGHPAKRFLFFS